MLRSSPPQGQVGHSSWTVAWVVFPPYEMVMVDPQSGFGYPPPAALSWPELTATVNSEFGWNTPHEPRPTGEGRDGGR